MQVPAAANYSRHTVILHRKAKLLPWGTWVWMYRPSKLYPLWHPIKINVSNNLHTFLKHMLFHGHLHVSVLHLNAKETSWGLKGPVAYISYHCVSLKNRFLLKRYVFLKNIVLHNIICETKWIVITTKFYRFFCEKVTQKTETGLLGHGPSSCVIQTKWHVYKKIP